MFAWLLSSPGQGKRKCPYHSHTIPSHPGQAAYRPLIVAKGTEAKCLPDSCSLQLSISQPGGSQGSQQQGHLGYHTHCPFPKLFNIAEKTDSKSNQLGGEGRKERSACFLFLLRALNRFKPSGRGASQVKPNTKLIFNAAFQAFKTG